MGTLLLVATPIGNLEDISQRALRILGQVSLIAAEDTRHTRKLLDHYKIHTPSISYHEHNKISRIDDVLAALSSGDVALVSDAGTPGLNDPGYELVRAALQAGFSVSPIPGPSAPVAALVASGLPTDAFLYLGYLPRKKGERLALLEQYSTFPHTIVFLESPHRLLASLQDIHTVLADREIAVARELTKLYEEIFHGCTGEAVAYFSNRAIQGEITLVIDGQRMPTLWSEDQVISALQTLHQNKASPSQSAAEIAARSGWPRRKLYRLMTHIQAQDAAGHIADLPDPAQQSGEK